MTQIQRALDRINLWLSKTPEIDGPSTQANVAICAVKEWRDALDEAAAVLEAQANVEECKYCAKGWQPLFLDEDGVRCDITGKPGVPGHAYEDSWWPCPTWRRGAQANVEEKKAAFLREFDHWWPVVMELTQLRDPWADAIEHIDEAHRALVEAEKESGT